MSAETETHLFVLHHGLWGNPDHLDYIVKQLKKVHPSDAVTVLNSEVNEGLLTYDGVDGCGDRQAQRVEQTVEELEKKGVTVTKISFIGYSMGGLFNRYAVGRLHAKEFFSKHTPYNFITVATPNLGVRKPDKHTTSLIYHNLVHFVTLRTGSQITLADDFTGHGEPLLVVLSDPRYVFVRALAQFKKRTLFANTRNDIMVRYTTAAIENSNPYRKSDAIVMDVERYPSIVKPRSAIGDDEVDSAEGVETKSRGIDGRKTRVAGKEPWPKQTLGFLSVAIILSPVLLPLWIIMMTSGLNYARFKVIRKRRTEKIDYDTRWFEEFNLNKEQPSNQVVLVSGSATSPAIASPEDVTSPAIAAPEDATSSSSASGSTRVDPLSDTDNIRDEDELDELYYSLLVRVVPPGEFSGERPPIDPKNIGKVRRWMVDSMNALGWEKIDASFPNTNAHAAIVVRRGPHVDVMNLLVRRLVM
ncbi:putative serine esterase-domain-containing protein [Cladochytrium replicatum]|nr:putative serine esterase-domain-containing protein [Cladochytrium replicatum]